jgi:hypothetical protein
MMLNANERQVWDQYSSKGWKIHHSGAPDFLLKRKKDTGGFEYLFIEVKSGDDKLRPQQRAWRTALRSVGATYELIRLGSSSKITSIYRDDIRRAAVVAGDDRLRGYGTGEWSGNAREAIRRALKAGPKTGANPIGKRKRTATLVIDKITFHRAIQEAGLPDYTPFKDVFDSLISRLEPEATARSPVEYRITEGGGMREAVRPKPKIMRPKVRAAIPVQPKPRAGPIREPPEVYLTPTRNCDECGAPMRKHGKGEAGNTIDPTACWMERTTLGFWVGRFRPVGGEIMGTVPEEKKEGVPA